MAPKGQRVGLLVHLRLQLLLPKEPKLFQIHQRFHFKRPNKSRLKKALTVLENSQKSICIPDK